VAGLKLAAAYSITGAVVAEWLGGSRGLGIFMLSLKKGYSTDRLFGTVIIIIASSLALWGAVSLAGRLAFPWISKDRAADANRKD
jgi:ABC-type nitrate/sulfonate/bicarbonate transport system permease component